MIFTDQINHKFKLDSTPKRIVSVVPSQTELLFSLGLNEKVVGITKFCVHPHKWFTTKIRIGGTKNINLSKIAELKPDLIIANKEENTKEQIEELQKLYPVYTSNISNLTSSLEMIKTLGIITDTSRKSEEIITEINNQFKSLTLHKPKSHTVLYLIWKNPYMSIGENTFIHDMMKRCGFENVISGDIDYPTVTEIQLLDLKPDFIFLSSEPYPFAEKHKNEIQNRFPEAKILLVNGEYFSWYGSRLQQAVGYFIGLMEKMA